MTMFTQCPDCRKSYPVTVEQLQGELLVFCTECSKEFNALELLNEDRRNSFDKADTEPSNKDAPKPKTKAKSKTKKKPKKLPAPKKLPINLESWQTVKDLGLPAKNPSALLAEVKAEFIPKAEIKREGKFEAMFNNGRQVTNNISATLKNHKFFETITGKNKPQTADRLPWESQEAIPININWAMGFVIGCVLLIAQVIYFESGSWSQNVAYRPYLEQACRWLGCILRDYENLEEISVLKGSFISTADNAIVFRAVLNNQALFQQRLPNIKLTLLDYNEQPFAQRLFAPKDYKTGDPKNALMPDSNLEVKLTIAVPRTPVGGYYFDLVN